MSQFTTQLRKLELFVTLAAALAVCGEGRTNAAEPCKLRVMTYNLRYASDKPPNSWPQRRPAAKAMLENAAPDLIGTQEGLYPQLKDLAADVPAYDWLGLGRAGGSRDEFMAVFYRRARFEPLEYDHYWLSDTPDVIGSRSWGNTVRRMVTWVKFRDRPSGAEFYFINTHFDHQVQASREKSAELVLTSVNALNTSLPVLLVGDFNAAALDNRCYDLLVGQHGFRDAWSTAAVRGPLVGTFHDFRGPLADGSRIDWILHRGEVTVERAEIVTFSLAGQFPSDHFPVTADLSFPPAAR